MSWKNIQLAEFLEDGLIDVLTGPFGTQLKASDYAPEGTPLINVRNIGYGELRLDKLEFVPDQVVLHLSKHLLKTHDIVFGRKGAVDRHLLVKESEAGWMQGSDCIRLRVMTNEIDPVFLSFALKLPSHKQWMITQCSNKATMASLNQDIIGRICVKLPDTLMQARIASILSAYDDLIENNRRRIQLLEQAARLLYREWFVRLRFPGHEHVKIKDGVPEGWENKRLGDLCIEIRESVKPNAFESNTPYIGLEHIPRRSISLDEWGLADQVTSSKHRFLEGDILFGKIRPYFHKVGVAFVDGIASSDAIVIRPNRPILHGIVLMTVSSDAFVALTAQNMREGSKMPRADWKQMQAYSVQLPPHELLSIFEKLIGSIIDQLKTIILTNNKLRIARDLLLPRLINGEIEV
jgi:type I restriction enzyme S subunit